MGQLVSFSRRLTRWNHFLWANRLLLASRKREKWRLACLYRNAVMVSEIEWSILQTLLVAQVAGPSRLITEYYTESARVVPDCHLFRGAFTSGTDEGKRVGGARNVSGQKPRANLFIFHKWLMVRSQCNYVEQTSSQWRNEWSKDAHRRALDETRSIVREEDVVGREDEKAQSEAQR